MIEIFIKTSLILASLLAALYCAYTFGLLTLTSHASVLYVGRITKAKFAKSSGSFKRVINLGEAKPYCFTLKCELTEGSVEVLVTDKGKITLLSLDSQNATGIINVKEPSRYTLTVKIKKASGSYELDWD